MYKTKVYEWSNKNATVQMLGRFQPWHNGHQKLFEKILKKTGQVYIMIKNVHGIGDNPFTFKEVKLNIDRALKKFPNRYKVVSVPNITNICYGRTVGYKIEKINLDKKIHQISATKIRDDLRKKGKL